MKRFTRPTSILFLLFPLLALAGCQRNSDVIPQEKNTPISEKTKIPRPFTRLFIQDLESSALKWVDVRVGDKEEFTIGELATIEGFKKLDPTQQKLVQMAESDGLICVGIRDNNDGKNESGWVLIRSGVGYIDHGDHGHWTFKDRPEVIESRLDTKQGNPAHLYLYNGRFFVANDKLNGYTRIDPKDFQDNPKGKTRFLVGGGNHITLAVVDDKVGYSAWIDGGGPNKGRVDVTPITNQEKTEPSYSFTLPTGGIHGATTNSGKVFFAPADGICWVEADTSLKRKPDSVQVNHISLGNDGGKPNRTGAFNNYSHYVLFVTGKEDSTRLVLLDAKQPEPKPHFLPLGVKKGSQATTPEVVVSFEGKAYAFIFHDHAKDVDVEDLLEIVALDPNGDGNCNDAKSIKTLKVGKSQVEGHFGHHDVAFDAEKRYAFFTNPAEGTLSILSLKTLEIVKTLKIGGTPTHLLAVGSRETDH